MVAVPWVSTAPVPPPAYHRAQAKVGPALHLDALTLVRRLHLLALGRLAVRLAQRRCPPPVPAGPGGHPRVYAEESLLLLALLRTLWRLSYQDLHDWLVDWPALALACGLPPDGQGRGRVPSPAQQCKRSQRVGAPPYERLFVVLVHLARHTRLVSGRDIIIDSAPILAWRRRDPDAAVGHAPPPHPRPLLRGYRVHTLLCRGSGLPLLFLLSPANVHDAPFARPLLELARHLYGLRPHRRAAGCRLLGLALDRLDPHHAGGGRRGALESEAPEEPHLPAAKLDGGGTGQTRQHRALLWPRLLAVQPLPLAAPTLQRPPLTGWTAVETRVALTYAATLVVGIAAQQAGRPDLIRSPTRVLAHTWEGLPL